MAQIRNFAAQLPIADGQPAGLTGSIGMLASEISVACDARDGMAARVRSALERAAFDRHLLSAGQREACADCYARHVIYSDPLGRFTILAIVWGAGQFSAPHAHDTWCAYAVYENPLQETVYGIGPRALKAKPVCTKAAIPAIVASPVQDLIKSTGSETPARPPAISIHVYGGERDRIGTHVNGDRGDR